MRFTSFTLPLLLVLPLSVLSAESSKDVAKDKTEKASDLARVAVMTFINEGNNVDYEWVEKSLPDAINDSMKARFEFARQDESKVTAI
ncbi:MAG TPA: hypothetical protein PKI36_02010, partial [Turneriella sp.]|nr:hypothetical protein [Turneriella sp.]